MTVSCRAPDIQCSAGVDSTLTRSHTTVTGPGPLSAMVGLSAGGSDPRKEYESILFSH